MTNETINILLVDDQPSRLLSYEVMLSDLGANLVKAGSGADALQLHKDSPEIQERIKAAVGQRT